MVFGIPLLPSPSSQSLLPDIELYFNGPTHQQAKASPHSHSAHLLSTRDSTC